MRTQVEILTARLCWRFARSRHSGDTLEEFLNRFARYQSSTSGYTIAPGLINGWESGTRGISKGWARRLNSVCFGTEHVYLLREFLRLHRQRSKNALALMKEHELLAESDHGVLRWQFPKDGQKAENASPAASYRDGTDEPRKHGGFYSMLAILALIRDLRRQKRAFFVAQRYIEDLYRLLPEVVRLAWVKPDADLLLQCIEDMLRSRKLVVGYLPVNWSVFQTLASMPIGGCTSCFCLEGLTTAGQLPDVIGHHGARAEARPVPIFTDGPALHKWVRPYRVLETPPKRLRLSWPGLGELLNPSPRQSDHPESSGNRESFPCE